MKKKQPNKFIKPPTEETGFFEPYSYYARALRTWFVAYGIGGPAVMITHPDTLKIITSEGHAALVGWLFLAGVGVQVLVAFLNKISMWYVYCGEVEPDFQKTWKHKIAEWFSEQFWIDIVADVTSLVTLGYSTVIMFQAFAKYATTP